MNHLTEAQKIDIAENNQGLIGHVAKKLNNVCQLDYYELFSIASLGFTKALNGYDTNNKAKFSTYAVTCMKNEIFGYLRKENKHTINDVSLQNILASNNKNGSEQYLEDIVPDEDIEIEEDTIMNDRKKILEDSLKHLSENEKYILIYRNGLFNNPVKTQVEVAEDIGMSQANVSKIETYLYDKMQKILRNKYFMED